MRKLLTVVVLCIALLMVSIPVSASIGGMYSLYIDWSFDESTGTLCFTGTDAISRWLIEYGPWRDFVDEVVAVDIGDGIVGIGDLVFANMKNLKRVTMADSVTWIGKGTFSGCTSLESIQLSSNLQTIGKSAFSNSGLVSIYIPEQVNKIPANAFKNCDSLETVYAPDSLVLIDDKAFYGCDSLKSFETYESTGEDEYVADVDSNGIQEEAFYSCDNLEKVMISKWLRNIRTSAFAKCVNLKQVQMTDGLKSIDGCAFEGCTALSKITLPNTVTSIGERSFASCSSLGTVVLSERLRDIGDEAFAGCIRLGELQLPEGLETIGKYAFAGCTGIRSIVLPEGMKEIGSYAFTGSSFVEVILPQSLEVIADYAFKNSSIQEIVIPAGVKSIGKDAFYPCGKLRSIRFMGGAPEEMGNLTFIGRSDGYKTNIYYPIDTAGWEKYDLHSVTAVWVPYCSQECEFGSWEITKEATYTEEGMEQRTCTLCHAVEERAIPQKEFPVKEILLCAFGIDLLIAGTVVLIIGLCCRKKKKKN